MSEETSLAVLELNAIASSTTREDIYDYLITYDLIPEYQQRSDAKVVFFYKQNFEFYRGNVALDDVISSVYEYNYNIMRTYASLVYRTGEYDPAYLHSKTEEDIIEELAGSEEEMLSYDYLSDIDSYVERILVQNKLGFQYHMDHDVYWQFQSAQDVSIVCDSQNLLFPLSYEVSFWNHIHDECFKAEALRVIPYEQERGGMALRLT